MGAIRRAGTKLMNALASVGQHTPLYLEAMAQATQRDARTNPFCWDVATLGRRYTLSHGTETELRADFREFAPNVPEHSDDPGNPDEISIDSLVRLVMRQRVAN